MERSFVFKNYRNVGFEKDEKLVINHSLGKGKLGNLIVLIGPNNSGKSNVLDGIQAFNSTKIDLNRNKTTLSFEAKYQKPEISLVTKDGDEIYSVTVSSNEPYKTYKMPEIKKVNLSIDQVKTALKEICSTILVQIKHRNLLHIRSFATEMQQNIISIDTNSISKDFQKKAIDILHNLLNLRSSNYECDRVINLLTDSKNLILTEALKCYNTESHANMEYKAKYNINIVPQVLRYNQTEITNNQLFCFYHEIKNNTFIVSLLNAINVSISEIENIYNAYKNQSNKGILTSNEKILNKKLKRLSDDFNILYLLEEDTYRFELNLESEKIFFNIFKNDVPLTLDYQSTGFKWFFNLYFNLLCKNPLQSGDILIMDEPATNLHIGGQEELRKFLKDFAIKNDLIIIIATHLPAFIDLDYLDEIRLVSPVDGKATIENDFSTINLDDADSLFPIKNALTVRNHMLLDPDKKVVFVEGITDYNYMTAFKKQFGYGDIVFLPVKGIGKSKEEHINISKRLLEVRKHGSILMVDADAAGKGMKNTNSDSELDVFCLSDVDANFKTIESLFTEQDLKTLGFVDDKGKLVKHSSTSALFKNSITEILPSLSKTTLNNFKKVFDYIDSL